MDVSDFLLQRSEEELARAGCQYEVTADGRLRCLSDCCATTREKLAQRELIARWADDPEGRILLRLLADEHSAHPDYRPEWHRIDIAHEASANG